VNPKRVYRLLREDNLLCVRKRKFVVTTNSNHGRKVYPNLASAMALTGVDQLWRAAITYVRLREEFVFLGVILDAFSRRVIGWALDRNIEDELTLTALRMALSRRSIQPGLVHHSDRGSQYANNDYLERDFTRKTPSSIQHAKNRGLNQSSLRANGELSLNCLSQPRGQPQRDAREAPRAYSPDSNPYPLDPCLYGSSWTDQQSLRGSSATACKVGSADSAMVSPSAKHEAPVASVSVWAFPRAESNRTVSSGVTNRSGSEFGLGGKCAVRSVERVAVVPIRMFVQGKVRQGRFRHSAVWAIFQLAVTYWCERGDSNPHGLLRQILSLF
jgi:hypothetical protein